jgi:UDP-N-acetylglucosamine 2-epimerase (non-hydrolysing)
MTHKKIFIVAGARPNFMKIAPIVRELQKHSDIFQYEIVHTGQHYDREMSGVFFEELNIPPPDHYLECGGGSHAEQTGKIMIAFERICQKRAPDCVLVVGDVNSTLACAIVAKKMQIKTAHVEAGLRSGDHSMPEEINRLVTDSISDWLFCTEPTAVENLLHEGKSPESLFHVGHVMADNLLYQLEQLTNVKPNLPISNEYKAKHQSYGVVTLHRPSNVDDADTLARIILALNTISRSLPLIFPIHPRTQSNLEKFGLALKTGITLTGPLSYMEFLNIWKDANVVLTDSGGLQEETTILGIPCLTLRENTERPITLEEGTNRLVGTNYEDIVRETERILTGNCRLGKRPELWDGLSSDRIVAHLRKLL